MRTFIQRKVLLAICLMASVNIYAQLSGTSYAEAQKSKTATWAFAYTETPSFASKQPNGSIQGLAVEVMKKFADFVQQTEGIKVTYEFKGKDPADFKGLFKEVNVAKGDAFRFDTLT